MDGNGRKERAAGGASEESDVASGAQCIITERKVVGPPTVGYGFQKEK